MSDLDLRAEIARIDRERAETQKFVAETRKLMNEADKLGREYRWYPWVQMIVTLGAIVVAALALLHR
jgi:ABC-type phosphate/phosphonate transport system permease subunit